MPTYSFLNVQASIAGPGGQFSVGSESGAAEEGITAEWVDDKNTMTIGAGGDAMHSLHAGKAGTVTIRLLKTSPVNAQLQDLYNLQTSDSNLHGQNILSIRDTARGDVITGREAAFKRGANVTFAKDGNVNEWIFDVAKLDMKLGTGVPDANVA